MMVFQLVKVGFYGLFKEIKLLMLVTRSSYGNVRSTLANYHLAKLGYYRGSRSGDKTITFNQIK